MNNVTRLLDPTAETMAQRRSRLTPPRSMEGLRIGLLDINKIRADVFLDGLEKQLDGRAFTVTRYVKPTFTRPAPLELIQSIAQECDLVVEALAD